jgi:hypothetical protein
MEEKILAGKIIFPDRARFPKLKYSPEVEDIVKKLL